jgi:uncharacterized protein (UPF0332 family)
MTRGKSYKKDLIQYQLEAFDMRQAGDYQKSRVITKEQTFKVLTSAEQFVNANERKLLNA